MKETQEQIGSERVPQNQNGDVIHTIPSQNEEVGQNPQDSSKNTKSCFQKYKKI